MAEPKKKKIDESMKEEEKKKWIEDKEKEWKALLEESKKEEVKEEPVVEDRKIVREEPKKGGSMKINLKYILVIGVVLAALISIVVCKLMVPILAPTLDEFNTRMGSIAATFNSHSSRMDGIEGSIPDVSDFVLNTTFNRETSRLEDRISRTEDSLDSVGQNISGIWTEIGSQVKVPLIYNLTGTFGNYTLSVKAIEAGNFTSRLNLVYQPARNVSAVNSTLEEALLSFNSTWLTSFDKNYTPSLVYDGQWKISQVSFLTSKFSLMANNITTVSINFTGLNVTPDYVFAEVFKVL